MKINGILQKEGSYFIWELYKQLLNRPPHRDELIHHQIQLQQGMSKQKQIIELITSPQAIYLYQTPPVSHLTPHSTIADIIRSFYSLPITEFIYQAFTQIKNSAPPGQHDALLQKVTLGKINRESFIAELINSEINKGTSSGDLDNRIMEIEKLVSPIDGWLTTKEGSSLYKLARIHAPVPTIVEVGSFKGRSTAWLSFAVKDRGSGTVYAVDHWQDWGNISGAELYQTFLRNLRALNLLPFVKPIQSDTIAAAMNWPLHQEIGLLFIDAVHEYEAVRRDFEFWSPRVKAGGYIVFHDVDTWPGPTRLVEELPRWIKKIEQADSCWIGQKMG